MRAVRTQGHLQQGMVQCVRQLGPGRVRDAHKETRLQPDMVHRGVQHSSWEPAI